MLEVTRRFEFAAAHHLPHHDGPCRLQHGHNFQVEVTCRGPLIEDGPQRGMIVEFGDLQAVWDEHLDPLLDHNDLNQSLVERGLGRHAPTTERLADWLLNEFLGHGVPVYSVRVWETPKNSATATLDPQRAERSLNSVADTMESGDATDEQVRMALEMIASYDGDLTPGAQRYRGDHAQDMKRLARVALGWPR